MTYSGIKIAFGGGPISMPGRAFETVKQTQTLLDSLEKLGVKIIDTAQLYGESETILGEAGAPKRFIIDTKAVGGFGQDPATKDVITEAAKNSLKRLQTEQVDVYYIHSPEKRVPIADTLAGIDAMHKAGAFKRFGLSNFLAADVEAVYNHCKENNYVLPTVYQGNYNPVARKQEEVLFPTLRKLGISFYAYSPLAGGFLTKNKEFVQDGSGRFDPSTMIGKIYSGLYNKPSYLEALSRWNDVAEKEGVSKAELAYRWVAFNSPLKPENGDAIIVGASSLEQLEQTVEGLHKGPLSKEAVEGIDAVWKSVEHEAGLDNFNG